MKTIDKLLSKSNYQNTEYSFINAFNQIIKDKIEQYAGNDKQKLKSFLEDLQHGGCQSGMIGDFVYHADCKAFYIEHLDSIEDFIAELEDGLGRAIENKQNIYRPTFVVWVCFEEYCYNLYNVLFE